MIKVVSLASCALDFAIIIVLPGLSAAAVAVGFMGMVGDVI